MPEEIIQFFTQISWAGVAGLFVFYVLKPIFERVFQNGLYKRVDKIEKNHLTDIERRLDKIEGKIEKIEEKIAQIESEIGYLKGKINNLKK